MTALRTSRGLRGAFSLIELMVVVVILGMLATVVLVTIGGETDEARVTTAKAQVRQLYDALLSYRTMCEQRNYDNILPDELQGLIDGPPEFEGWRPSVRNIPKDPWGNDYDYIIEDPDYGDFTVICYGADEQEGGEGYNEDIRESTMRE